MAPVPPASPRCNFESIPQIFYNDHSFEWINKRRSDWNDVRKNTAPLEFRWNKFVALHSDAADKTSLDQCIYLTISPMQHLNFLYWFMLDHYLFVTLKLPYVLCLMFCKIHQRRCTNMSADGEKWLTLNANVTPSLDTAMYHCFCPTQ